jgi:hypothetical protein
MDVPQPAAEAGADKGLCAAHPHNAAVGACARCGNFLCNVCRTRWRERLVCAACVDRAFEAGEAAPPEARAHTRQAVLALVCGLVGWGVFVAGMVLVAVGMEDDPPNFAAVAAGGLVLLASPLAGVFGVGQGAAAVRARGDHLVLATLGLLLSGTLVGVVLGLCVASAFQA